MATDKRAGGNTGGISLGGILVIVGIVLMIVWSFWVGLIIALIGLVAFGGSRRGSGTERRIVPPGATASRGHAQG